MDFDRNLAARIKEDDSSAYTLLVNNYYFKVLSFIVKTGFSEEDARDITQEVFIRVYRFIHTYNPNWVFSTWLFRIAINACKDARRRFHSNKQDLYHDMDQLGLNYKEQGIENLHEKELLKEMLSAVDDQTREIFILRYHNGLNSDEIAKIYQISAENVRMRLSRAKNKMVKTFQKMQGGAGL